MSSSAALISFENGCWTVTVSGPTGRLQRYECPSQSRAQTFAALFSASDRRTEARAVSKRAGPRSGWLDRLRLGRR